MSEVSLRAREQERGRTHHAPGLLLSDPTEELALLEAVGLVAGATFLADAGEIRLQRVEVLDLGLGLSHHLGEARDLGVKAGLVFPDLWRWGVVALPLGI